MYIDVYIYIYISIYIYVSSLKTCCIVLHHEGMWDGCGNWSSISSSERAARVFSKLTNHLKERMSMLNYW